MCPHGIVYAAKNLLRAESPRDHVDLLLSLRYMPTITICDIPGFVARHGNIRQPKLFHPNDGKFAPAAWLEEHSETERIDLPEVDLDNFIFNQTMQDHGYGNLHPVSRTSATYCAFDRLHQNNSSNEIDHLRRLDKVRQLEGKINSQAAEEAFAIINKSRSSLTQMSSLHHLFMVRLLLHLINIKKNGELRQNIEKRLNSDEQTVADAVDGSVMIASKKSEYSCLFIIILILMFK